MKNRDRWQPTKFVYRRGKLVASRGRGGVGAGSRLCADAVARFYDTHLRHHARGRLLDLGCGEVPLFFAYKDFVTDNTCVDWGDSPHGGVHVDFQCDLTAALPFADGEFDTILLSDVLEHIAQPEKLWHEMTRLLAPGGKLLMNVPFFYWLHEQPHDYYRYTEHALRRFVRISGLKLIHLESLGGAPEIMTDIFAKNVLSVPKVGRPIALMAQAVTSAFIRTGFGRKVSVATGQSFPFGYSLVAEKI